MQDSRRGELVIDASVVLSWIFPDESNEYADHVIDSLVAHQGLVPHRGLVPHIFHFEVRNILLMAERGDRIDADTVSERLSRLDRLPIDTDFTPNLDAAFELARKHRLTFYDALYLELALRRGAQLATLDKALERAAAVEGVLML